MPADVKSKAQQRWAFGAEARGDIPAGTARRMAKSGRGYDKLPERVKKSVAYKLQGRTEFQGLKISIENRKGSVRRWFDPHGNEKGSTKMHWGYGYIRGTEGTDGDHVDVYIGPNPQASHAFVVNQMKKPGNSKDDGKAWTEFDEQKVMLGWDSAEAAKAAYMKQYDDPRFFGSIKAIPMDEFKEKVMSKANHGKKVAARLRLAKAKLAGMSVDKLAHDELLVELAELGVTKIAMTPNKMRELISQGAGRRGYSLSPEEQKDIATKSIKYFKNMKTHGPGHTDTRAARQELRGLIGKFKKPGAQARSRARASSAAKAHDAAYSPGFKGVKERVGDAAFKATHDPLTQLKVVSGLSLGGLAAERGGRAIRKGQQSKANKERSAARRDYNRERKKAAADVPAARKRDHDPAPADAATALRTLGTGATWASVGGLSAPMILGARRTVGNTMAGAAGGALFGSLAGYAGDKVDRRRLTKARETTKQLKARTAEMRKESEILDNPEDPLHTPPTARKLSPTKKAELEKMAAELYDDFEYMAEAEKTAVVSRLARAGGALVQRAATAASGAGRKAQAWGRLRQIKAKNIMPGVGTIDADIARGAAGVTKAPAAAAKATTPAAATAAATKSRGLLSGKNLAKAGLVGTGALGLYAGKKGIDTASALATPDHGQFRVPSVQGQGRVF